VEIEADNLFLAKRAIAGSHRAAQQASRDSGLAARERVFVDGKPIPAHRVIGKEESNTSTVRSGRGPGWSLQPGDSGVMIHSPPSPTSATRDRGPSF